MCTTLGCCIGVEKMGVWCEEERSWISEIWKKQMEKTGKKKFEYYLVRMINIAI